MPRRFVDASVFVHAFLRPKRELRPHEREIKDHARAIVARISHGETVVTSTVHVIEVANILEDRLPLVDAQTVEKGLIERDTVDILPVEGAHLVEGLAVASEVGTGTSDGLAVTLMREVGLTEVYSFDRRFDRFEGIRRVSR